MAAHILIAHDHLSERIALASTLASPFTVLHRADDIQGALEIIADTPIDLAIIGESLSREAWHQLRTALAAPVTLAPPPILIVSEQPTPQSRVVAMRQGASDVIATDTARKVLLARVRSLLRGHNKRKEMAQRRCEIAELGFADPVSDFAPKLHVALHAPLAGWAKDFDGSHRISLRNFDRSDPALVTEPDLYVLRGCEDGLSTMKALTSPDGLANRTCLIALTNNRRSDDITMRALDLGAAAVLPYDASPCEIALIMSRHGLERRHHFAWRHMIRKGLAMATTDSLTGLFNRAYVFQRLHDFVKVRRHQGQGFCLAMFDIDYFKRINDQYGHPTGDAVLQEIAQRLRSGLRDGDILGRIGGEEFMALMPGISAQDAFKRINQLCKTITKMPIRNVPKTLRVTMSVGLAIADRGHEPDDIYALADAAMYCAKKRGRNRIELATMPEVAEHRIQRRA